MSNALSGISSLAYQGTNAANPPNICYATVNPTQYDSQNFSLLDLWLNTSNQTAWILVSLSQNLATWVELGVASTVLKLAGNSGGTVSPNSSNTINVVGDGTTITITGNPGTNTLTASLVSGGVVDTLTGDTGGPIGPNGSGTIFIKGTPGVLTVTGTPLTNTLTLNTASAFATTYVEDSGSASPSSNTIHIVGGSNINTSGSGSTVTVNLDSTLTGLTNLTVQNLTVTNSETFSNLGAGVVQSNGSGVISSSEGTDGQLLIGSSTGAPAWANITAGSNVTITNGHNSITIAASGGGGGSPGLVLLQTQNATGQIGINFSAISSTYINYLLVCNGLQYITSNNGAVYITYIPTFNACYGGVLYSAYNSTSLSNVNVYGSGAYPIAPLFGTGVSQLVSFEIVLYGLSVPVSGGINSFYPLTTGQCTVNSAGQLYQGTISAIGYNSGLPAPSEVTGFNVTGAAPGGLTALGGTIELYGFTN